jgi:hypothetical protein
VQELQERLELKGQQLEQRQMLLAEVSALAAHLAAQAGEGYPAKLAAAEELCSAQSKLKGATRKIMALVSELSMYQVRGHGTECVCCRGCLARCGSVRGMRDKGAAA